MLHERRVNGRRAPESTFLSFMVAGTDSILSGIGCACQLATVHTSEPFSKPLLAQLHLVLDIDKVVYDSDASIRRNDKAVEGEA